MNVRTKMISVLALLFAVLIVLDIGIQKLVLMPSFAELERDDARTSMRRIDNVLNITLDNLQLNAADWGNWADAYKFVQGLDTDFAKTNITAAALKQMQVNTVMLVGLKGNVVVASSGDLDSGAPIEIDLSANTVLPENFPWRRNVAEGKAAKGLIKTNRGVMMLVGAPILDGTGRGPWMGMVIMGRLLTSREVRQIGAQAQATVSMNADLRPGGADELTETGTATEVSRRFADIYGSPLMTLHVQVPRKITQRGQSAVSYASTYLVVASLAALILLVIVLNRVVLAPLARVTRHAVAIGEGTDLTARLNLPGRDEVAVLAGEFDRMVERVAESRRQLMDQSYQAGFAELAKGVLHNLGNAMTPLGVRLTKLGERLRDAPCPRATRFGAIPGSAGIPAPRLPGTGRLSQGRASGCDGDSAPDHHRPDGVVRTHALDAKRACHGIGPPSGPRLADARDRARCLPPAAHGRGGRFTAARGCRERGPHRAATGAAEPHHQRRRRGARGRTRKGHLSSRRGDRARLRA